MSHSSQVSISVDEAVPLRTVPGEADTENNNDMCSEEVSSTGQCAAPWCTNNHYRKLAICSIICGLSCIGIIALKNSVKAKYTTDQRRAAEFSQKAKKCGLISIGTWVAILVFFPVLMVFISYLLTFQE